MIENKAITKVGQLSVKELKKSARDSVVIAGVIGSTALLEILIPFLEKMANTDFGDNTAIISFVISSMAIPLANRYLNVLRVK